MEKDTMEVAPLQQILGNLASRYPSFLLRLGRLETRWLKDLLAAEEIDRPIYVTGLARSGTTIILELLASHAQLASHKYRDFPFVHVPYWWNWFVEHSSSTTEQRTERAHKDRIFVSPDSPEAMEEILWMAFFPGSHDPSVSQVLGARDSHPEFETFYRDSIRKLLMARKASRYLSKGNYNISRLGYLGRLFPDARFVVPVREPTTHIASLMKQHRLFCEAEKRDAKVLRHMKSVGHFEFGLNLTPINFGDPDTVRRIQTLWNTGEEVRGWAAYWASAYSFVADLLENDPSLASRVLIVDYTDFCTDPAAVLRRVYSHCELDLESGAIMEQAARISPPTYYRVEFGPREIASIREETEKTVSRIQNLRDEPVPDVNAGDFAPAKFARPI